MSIGYCPTCQAAPIIGDDYCPTCHRTGRTDAWVKSLPEYKPDAFGTRLSADGVNRLGDTIADLRMQVKEMVDTLRMAREALDNDEFALCAGMIDAAMKVGADKTANAKVRGPEAALPPEAPSPLPGYAGDNNGEQK